MSGFIIFLAYALIFLVLLGLAERKLATTRQDGHYHYSRVHRHHLFCPKRRISNIIS